MHARTAPHQVLHHVGLALGGGNVQRGPPVVITAGHVGAERDDALYVGHSVPLDQESQCSLVIDGLRR